MTAVRRDEYVVCEMWMELGVVSIDVGARFGSVVMEFVVFDGVYNGNWRCYQELESGAFELRPLLVMGRRGELFKSCDVQLYSHNNNNNLFTVIFFIMKV
jgi:hypothetical protein